MGKCANQRLDTTAVPFGKEKPDVRSAGILKANRNQAYPSSGHLPALHEPQPKVISLPSGRFLVSERRRREESLDYQERQVTIPFED